MFRFLTPFYYYAKTRLSLRVFLFQTIYEWVPGLILLLLFANSSVEETIYKYLLSYLSFISIYEIGYIFNDTYSIKNEGNPRSRFPTTNNRRLWMFFLILARVSFFLLVTSYLGFLSNMTWWITYLLLSISFIAHNLLDDNFRIFSFINLAFFRFITPVFPFLNSDFFFHVTIAVLLNYVFFRLFTYMDGKKLLAFKVKDNLNFKISFYLILSCISIYWTYLTGENLYIYSSLYFLFFWLSSLLFKKTFTSVVIK